MYLAAITKDNSVLTTIRSSYQLPLVQLQPLTTNTYSIIFEKL